MTVRRVVTPSEAVPCRFSELLRGSCASDSNGVATAADAGLQDLRRRREIFLAVLPYGNPDSVKTRGEKSVRRASMPL
jgi:hypothetical protein